MKKKTLLFGGAFDPPHKSHIRTAFTALKHEKFDSDTELWFLPCYSDAFGQKNLTSPEHRVAMLNCAMKYLEKKSFKVCTTEIEMANHAGAYAVIKELIRRHPDREFYYVLGSDQAGRIREWRNSRDLLKTVPFVIVKRQLITGCVEWCFSNPHIWINDLVKTFDMSPDETHQSSSIREAVRRRWEIFGDKMSETQGIVDGLLPETYQYILEHKLYKE